VTAGETAYLPATAWFERGWGGPREKRGA